MVPKQLAGEKRTQYYLLMFLEAYANGGRWGYYWWPGVDVETRVKATAPDQIKDYTRLITRYRQYFEGVFTQNRLAILYLDSSMMKRPEAHYKYIALAQALAEAGVQYDVIYRGDGRYAPDELDPDVLARYQAVLVPESNHLTEAQAEALSGFPDKEGKQLILFTGGQPDERLAHATVEDEQLLFRFWQEYQEQDRERIAATVNQYRSECIYTSDSLVNTIRTFQGEDQILHLINYHYHLDLDSVSPVQNLIVHLPWEGSRVPELRWITLEGEIRLACRREGGELSFEIPKLDLYGLAILS
jgi:hypothetical protein